MPGPDRRHASGRAGPDPVGDESCSPGPRARRKHRRSAGEGVASPFVSTALASIDPGAAGESTRIEIVHEPPRTPPRVEPTRLWLNIARRYNIGIALGARRDRLPLDLVVGVDSPRGSPSAGHLRGTTRHRPQERPVVVASAAAGSRWRGISLRANPRPRPSIRSGYPKSAAAAESSAGGPYRRHESPAGAVATGEPVRARTTRGAARPLLLRTRRLDGRRRRGVGSSLAFPRSEIDVRDPPCKY